MTVTSDKRQATSNGWTTQKSNELFFPRIGSILLLLSLVTCHLSPVTCQAAQLPSLFRGVVVADSPLGVRVVSVEAASQAALADLRPEDVIVSVDGREVRSIDAFSSLSTAMQGKMLSATVIVFRNGSPRQLQLHVYSYPIVRMWGVQFIPDHDLRFAEPRVGLEYWRRLGRGFEEARKPSEALNAYLNGLHHAPDDLATAFRISELSFQESRRHLASRQLLEGVASLRQALLIVEKLFDAPLTDEQMAAIKRELQATLDALRQVSGPERSRLDLQTNV